MTNHLGTFQDARLNLLAVIDWKPFDLPTDWPTFLQTDWHVQNNIPHPFLQKGDKITHFIWRSEQCFLIRICMSDTYLTYRQAIHDFYIYSPYTEQMLHYQTSSWSRSTKSTTSQCPLSETSLTVDSQNRHRFFSLTLRKGHFWRGEKST